MSDSFRELIRGFVLLGAIATGGYAYGTPGINWVTSALCGALSMWFVLLEKRD